VGIVDSFDAMTTTRPYRGSRSAGHACLELRDDAKRGKLDTALVERFVGLIERTGAAGTAG
ncbi:MAG TPA: hypothetical protein VHV78_08720, partial [Gemmatimonadaceae bacterium]|nr:hypothetical protein [Gemmatimonadaceae bacterium]